MSQEDTDMEYITLNQASKEFKIARPTLNWWVRMKILPATKELSDLGMEYWLVKRGDVSNVLQNRPKRGRPLSRG